MCTPLVVATKWDLVNPDSRGIFKEKWDLNSGSRGIFEDKFDHLTI